MLYFVLFECYSILFDLISIFENYWSVGRIIRIFNLFLNNRNNINNEIIDFGEENRNIIKIKEECEISEK